MKFCTGKDICEKLTNRVEVLRDLLENFDGFNNEYVRVVGYAALRQCESIKRKLHRVNKQMARGWENCCPEKVKKYNPDKIKCSANECKKTTADCFNERNPNMPRCPKKDDMDYLMRFGHMKCTEEKQRGCQFMPQQSGFMGPNNFNQYRPQPQGCPVVMPGMPPCFPQPSQAPCGYPKQDCSYAKSQCNYQQQPPNYQRMEYGAPRQQNPDQRLPEWWKERARNIDEGYQRDLRRQQDERDCRARQCERERQCNQQREFREEKCRDEKTLRQFCNPEMIHKVLKNANPCCEAGIRHCLDLKICCCSSLMELINRARNEARSTQQKQQAQSHQQVRLHNPLMQQMRPEPLIHPQQHHPQMIIFAHQQNPLHQAFPQGFTNFLQQSHLLDPFRLMFSGLNHPQPQHQNARVPTHNEQIRDYKRTKNQDHLAPPKADENANTKSCPNEASAKKDQKRGSYVAPCNVIKKEPLDPKVAAKELAEWNIKHAKQIEEKLLSEGKPKTVQDDPNRIKDSTKDDEKTTEIKESKEDPAEEKKDDFKVKVEEPKK